MMVDELQDFIENNLHADVDNETYNKLMNDAQSMDLRSFIDKNGDFLSEHSEGWNTFSQKKPKYVAERIVDSFGKSSETNPFKRSKNEIDEIYKRDFEDDVSREDFDKALNNMANYWDVETKTRDYEAGVKRREKEVKNWNAAKQLLTSEYEKERYIKEPEKAIFGKEAPAPFEAPETRGEALFDLGTGVAAGAAELYPGWGGAIAGPTIRGLRDVYHYNASDYKKDLGDMAKDIGLDLITNVGIQKLPNFRKEKKMFTGNSPVDEVLKADEITKTMKKDLENFPGIDELQSIDNVALFKKIEALPEGNLKNSLKQYAKDPYNIDRAGIADEINRGRKLVDAGEDKNIREGISTLIDNDVEFYPKIGERAYETSVVFQPKLTKTEKMKKPFVSTTRKILTDYSDQAMRLGTDAGVFPGKKSSPAEGPNINLTRDFLMGNVPNEDAPDWVKQQYKQWREDYYKKYKIYPEDDTVTRLYEE